MWLLLSHEQDPSAQWLLSGLQQRGLDELQWVTDQQLAQARRWCYRLDKDTQLIDIELQDGRRIDSERVRGVINRLQQISPVHAPTILPSERLYAFQEISALYLSWLNAFTCPVLNPASPTGLSGELLHVTQWAQCAHAAGLPVPPVSLSSSTQWYNCWHPAIGMPDSAAEMPQRVLYVVADQVVIPAAQDWQVSDELQHSCVRLAQISGLPLLEIRFISPDMHSWYFYMALPIPALSDGDEAVLDAIVGVLNPQTTQQRQGVV